MSVADPSAELDRLEQLDHSILAALDDIEQDLPDNLLSEREQLLNALFGGQPDASMAEPLKQALQRHQRIEQLARQRQALLGEAREKLHFSHRAVNAYLDNQP